jgi:Flp pilus assembly protein TadB
MGGIEDFMNWLSDMDWGWWPFLFLRPNKGQDMTTSHVAKMSLYYAFPIGLILAVLSGDWWSVLYMIVFFFLFYRLTFAYFWNRRARRLRNQLASEK